MGIIILVIIILGFVFIGKEKVIAPSETSNTTSQVQKVDPTRLCYQYKKESGLVMESNPPQPIYDIENISLVIQENRLVEGEHNILPAEKDVNRARFVGATDGNYANVIATAQAEGETWQEQRIYKYDQDRLYVGYQPEYRPRIQNDAGIYMYDTIEDIVYETEEFFLNRVECSELK